MRHNASTIAYLVSGNNIVVFLYNRYIRIIPNPKKQVLFSITLSCANIVTTRIALNIQYNNKSHLNCLPDW